MPLRVPLAQQTTTGLELGISFSLLPSSDKGMLIVPGAFPPANSPADLTSTKTAPFSFNVGSIAITRWVFHHL